MSGLDHSSFPKAPLLSGVALVGACLLGVGAVSAGWIGTPAPVVRDASPAVSRDVRFLDQGDGGVLVQAVDGGADMVIAPETGAFMRGLVRVLAQDRKRRGLGREPAFRLTEWSDGRLTLTDVATGRVLSVNAFGPDNRRAFTDLLHGRDA